MSMLRIAIAFSVLLTANSASVAAVSADGETLPDELSPFVEPDTQVLALLQADLNGDGREDAVLVLERASDPALDSSEEVQRPSLLLMREANGRLALHARNDRLVYCASCGGTMGDPFQDIAVTDRGFTVSHAGGSGWRWGIDTTFAWSRRHATWQLVRVEEVSFHAGAPDNLERTVSTPPKDFGRIDFADFDPEHWRDQGPR